MSDHPFGKLVSVSVLGIQILPQYQNVTPGAQVVEDIPLPQDYHGVPDR